MADGLVTIRAMKLQFSLATLLVCVTAFAVVAALCNTIKVHHDGIYKIPENVAIYGEDFEIIQPCDLPPKRHEVTRRMAIWEPVGVATSLAAIWAFHRVKSRRENGPPVG